MFSGLQAEAKVKSRKAARDRHTDRYVVGFCDGHVEIIKFDRLYSKDDSALRRWNRNGEPTP